MGIVSRSQGGGGSGAITQISDQLLSGSAATIDFSGIVATFNHLMLIVYGRGDAAAVSVTIAMRFNNDSAGNYFHENISAAAAAASGQESLTTTSIAIGDLAANTAPANGFSSTTIFIPRYANTTGQKHAWSGGGVRTSAVSGGTFYRGYSGYWLNTAAINRITLLPGTGNFIAGSAATLYGVL